MMVAADIYRQAAIDQLKVLGNRLNIEVFELLYRHETSATV